MRPTIFEPDGPLPNMFGRLPLRVAGTDLLRFTDAELYSNPDAVEVGRVLERELAYPTIPGLQVWREDGTSWRGYTVIAVYPVPCITTAAWPAVAREPDPEPDEPNEYVAVGPLLVPRGDPAWIEPGDWGA